MLFDMFGWVLSSSDRIDQRQLCTRTLDAGQHAPKDLVQHLYRWRHLLLVRADQQSAMQSAMKGDRQVFWGIGTIKDGNDVGLLFASRLNPLFGIK